MQYNYGGIQLQVVKTNEIAFEAVYTQDQIDYLYTRVIIDIQAIVNPGATSYTQQGGIPTSTPGTLPTTTVEAIRHVLSQPRRQLVIGDYLNQKMLAIPGDYDCDVKGGPFPKVHRIVEVQGSRTFLVRWSCEANIIECPAGTDAPVLISNRWSDQHTINEYHLTTRTATGRTVFRRDYLEAAGKFPDDYRSAILPPVNSDFQRTRVNIMVPPTGNELVWQVTDEERIYNLGETDGRQDNQGKVGSGIIRIEGTQGIQSIPSGPNGPVMPNTILVVELRALGSRYSDQWTMLQRILGLVATLVPKLGTDQGYWITNARVQRSLGMTEKTVDVVFHILQQPPAILKAGNIDYSAFEPPLSDIAKIFAQNDGNPNLPNDSGSRGSAIVAAMVQLLTVPCLDSPPAESIAGGPLDVPPPSVGPAPKVIITPVDELPDVPSRYTRPINPEGGSSPYSHYQLNMNWEIDNGIIQCPISTIQSSSGPPPAGTPTSALFRVAQPMAQLIVEGVAETLNGAPALPKMNPNDPNLKLIASRIVPEAPVIINDGVTSATRVSFWYKFAQIAAFNPNNPQLSAGVLPWTTLTYGENQLIPTDFVSGIIDDPSGTPTQA